MVTEYARAQDKHSSIARLGHRPVYGIQCGCHKRLSAQRGITESRGFSAGGVDSQSAQRGGGASPALPQMLQWAAAAGFSRRPGAGVHLASNQRRPGPSFYICFPAGKLRPFSVESYPGPCRSSA